MDEGDLGAVDPATGDPVLEIGLAPGVLMTEGDQMLVFLTPVTTTVVGDDWEPATRPAVELAGGALGAYVLNDDGVYTSAHLEGERVTIGADDLENRARVVTFRTGAPLDG